MEFNWNFEGWFMEWAMYSSKISSIMIRFHAIALLISLEVVIWNLLLCYYNRR